MDVGVEELARHADVLQARDDGEACVTAQRRETQQHRRDGLGRIGLPEPAPLYGDAASLGVPEKAVKLRPYSYMILFFFE